MGLYAVRVVPCHEYYLKSNDFRYKFLLKIQKKWESKTIYKVEISNKSFKIGYVYGN